MGTPSESGSSAQSGYNEGEISTLNLRLQAIEQLLELDTRFSGLKLPGRILNLENGIRSGTAAGGGFSSETITASGAASILKFLTILDGTTNASTVTLAAPASDGQLKLVRLAVSASNHPTLDGTNIVDAAGASEATKVGTFTAVGSFCLLCSAGAKWVILAKSVTFA